MNLQALFMKEVREAFRTCNPLILVGCLVMSAGLGAEEIPESFVGVRPAGMGNAFTGLANDHNAIWTNPAGIARVRKARSRFIFSLIHIPNLLAGINTEGEEFYKKLQSSGASKTDPEAIEKVLESLDNLSNASVWARAATSVTSFFDVPRGAPWALGAFSNSKVHVTRDADDSSVAIVDSINDIGGVLTLGFTNATNRFNFAFQLRPTLRFSYYDKVPIETLIDFDSGTKARIKDDSNNGLGVGVDAGMMWTFADFWFPTIGVAVRNLPTGCVDDYLNSFEQVRQKVCGTKFGGTVNNPDSPSLVEPMDGRIGISMTPRLTHKMALRFALDFHHIYLSPDNKTFYGLSGIEPIKQTHAGIELFFGNPLLLNPFSLRIGFNQGFVTYGGTIRLGFLLLEGAVFGQDISSEAKSQEDRRILLSLAAEFR